MMMICYHNLVFIVIVNKAVFIGIFSICHFLCLVIFFLYFVCKWHNCLYILVAHNVRKKWIAFVD